MWLHELSTNDAMLLWLALAQTYLMSKTQQKVKGTWYVSECFSAPEHVGITTRPSVLHAVGQDPILEALQKGISALG